MPSATGPWCQQPLSLPQPCSPGEALRSLAPVPAEETWAAGTPTGTAQGKAKVPREGGRRRAQHGSHRRLPQNLRPVSGPCGCSCSLLCPGGARPTQAEGGDQPRAQGQQHNPCFSWTSRRPRSQQVCAAPGTSVLQSRLCPRAHLSSGPWGSREAGPAQHVQRGAAEGWSQASPSVPVSTAAAAPQTPLPCPPHPFQHCGRRPSREPGAQHSMVSNVRHA